MATPMNEHGALIGAEQYGDNVDCLVAKVLQDHPDAAAVRLRMLVDERDRDCAADIINRIEARLGMGWCRHLAESLERTAGGTREVAAGTDPK